MVNIVYCTTNLINKKIYIGVHKTENPDKFDGYLGNGLWVNDSYLIKHPKEPFHYAVQKYGVKNFLRKTLKVCGSREEALRIEAELVNSDFIKRADTYNITIGGGDPPVYCKVIYQYTLEGDFIKQWNSILEASDFYKCGNSSIGLAIFNRTPSLRFFWSETKYDKLNLDLFHLDENKVKTYLYDIEGKLQETFKSITECAMFLKTTPSKILHCIKGKGCIEKLWYVSDIEYTLFPIPKKVSHRNCSVYQYDLEGNFLKEWNNFSEICQHFGKPNLASTINNSIKQGHASQGFQWSYEKLPFMKKLKNVSGRVRKVGRYSLSGELLETFDSVNSAKRAWGSGAVNVLRGANKTCKGYLFKYID